MAAGMWFLTGIWVLFLLILELAHRRDRRALERLRRQHGTAGRPPKGGVGKLAVTRAALPQGELVRHPYNLLATETDYRTWLRWDEEQRQKALARTWLEIHRLPEVGGDA